MRPALSRLVRGARRIGYQLAAVVAALVAVAVVLAVRHGSAEPSGTATGDVVRVGVGQGASIPAYLRDSRDRLDAMPAGQSGYALVSLAGYLSPGELVPVLAGVETFQVYARVPLPDVQTAIVKIPVATIPDDVTAGMDAEAGERARQASRAGDQVAATEAERYRQHCACVYAAVVRAPAGTLRQLAARASVRAVDPAPRVSQLDLAVFLPPLPEQSDTAQPPKDSAPLPSGSK
ncbi:hypothetical protein [Rugosimonospora africana]|uniref:Uncharacterized protein n=1 Tax=Rugosimonospora africana TaxID=556532 RepID=A0A8J3R2N8_9ACTN|nr:hypothetical protein [Rugosimonospora africana]GIH19071.1 hypothetical protein Raf01_72430 [Rugosimonospora africana]